MSGAWRSRNAAFLVGLFEDAALLVLALSWSSGVSKLFDSPRWTRVE